VERRKAMQHSDFSIGCEFVTPTGRWRCTDIGTRTVIAIRLNHDDDPTWYSGPPYALAEHIFDEEGIIDCDPAPERRDYDASGRSDIVVVRREVQN
jgi:hypothetical protein